MPALALATAVALLLAGVGMSLWFEQSYESQKVEEIGAQARILAATVTAALAFDDHKAATEYVNALKANPQVQAAAVYGIGGALVAGYSRMPREPLPESPPPFGPDFQGGRLTMVVPVQQGASSLGTVYVETLIDPPSRRAARYGVISLFVIMAALVVLVLGAGQRALARANAELQSRAADLAAANASLETRIKEREKAEEALRQAQKMEAIGQLTGGVAHDFNNLLQVIIGNLDGLRRRAGAHYDGIRPMVEAAVRGAERAATLTQRLLAFSRRQPLAPRPIEVNKLVAGLSDLLHRTLGETISVETVLAGGVWRVSADANQLESALLNLAVNARDAMPEGGKLTVETANAYLDEDYAAQYEEVRAGQYVAIAVTDTGTGMTKETLQKAFDPFFTTKEVGKGSGLGLSQVYGFVKQSGGHVKIYSELGAGTTVKLYLPRLLGAEAAADAQAEPRAVPAGASSELVLMVEDDEDVRANTVAMLRELGYGVLEATDGATALRLLEAEPHVRLLFTDVGLPGNLNGRQLADEARRRRPDLPVLFTTGYARNAIVHQGRLDPGVELIGKPFTYAALAAKIRQVLDGAGAKPSDEATV
jgi:signal transduction histidine kinase/CheY-like chemotaxis protein